MSHGLIIYLIFCICIVVAPPILWLTQASEIGDYEDAGMFSIIWVISMVFVLGLLGKFTVDSNKQQEKLKSALKENYNGYSSLTGDSFICNNKKYIYEMDYENDKLTVFLDDSKTIDGVYIDGKKQKDTDNTKDKTSTDIETEVNDNNSSKDTDMLSKIKDKITDKYPSAVITSFNSDNSGSFTYDDNYYNFDIEDDLLEIINLNDSNDVVYYKL